MIRLFCGYDPREAVGFHVFLESLIRTSSQPLSITPLCGEQKDGSNRFTYSRFLVPHLCDFRGSAIYLDGSDMLMRADIAELAGLADSRYAVQVVQHHYKTSHARKYMGTVMEAPNEDYPFKNWSSLIIWNCAHPKNAWLSPESVHSRTGTVLHRFSWLEPPDIGALPADWNYLVGEPQYAKIAHFTLGIPAIPHYRDSVYAQEWLATEKLSLSHF